jgi:hypothetical protein
MHTISMFQTNVAHDDADSAADRIESLEQELSELAGHLNAGNYRFLRLLAEFERRGGHVGWGIQSCAHWLSWKCGIGLVAARDKVRVARALEALPRLSDAMRRGTLSYCKIRALTRIATPGNDELLVSIGETGTVSHVEKAVRLYRKTERAQLATANAQHAVRHLQCYVDHDGCVVIRGRLTPEQGTLVMKALASAGDALREAERDSREASATPDLAAEPQAARQADALALLAETFLAHGAAPLAAAERHQVIVHVDERVLQEPTADGRCQLENGVAVPVATARRLCCDASLVRIVENAAGDAVDVGRKTRTIPLAMRRALIARDGGCRFPGCTNGRFVDAHHVVHWADGGETKQDNLLLLCRRHHRFVHEHGFAIIRDAGELCFLRPDGRRVPEAPRAGIESHVGLGALRSAHAEMDLRIDCATAGSGWRGERADYDHIVGALQLRTEGVQKPA